jgi:hypothetical protein
MKIFKMECGWYRAETEVHPFMSVEGASEKIVTDIISRFLPYCQERPVRPFVEKESITLPEIEAKEDVYKMAAKGGPIVDHRS